MVGAQAPSIIKGNYMSQKTFSFTPTDDDTNGFAAATAGTSGQPITLTATVITDGNLAHKVSILPSGSVTGSYTLTGTDSDGNPQTEVLATDTTNSVTSVKYYLTLTEVLAPAGIGANTVDIGWTDACISKTIPINWRQNSMEVSLGCFITGTIDYDVHHCFDSVQVLGTYPSTLNWFVHASIDGATTSVDGNYAFPVTATRLVINSSTSGATIDFSVVQGV